ncbi:hypothetical protein VTL71DRAFT_2502 [Oculimacula yallundae]|uniref:ABC transporter domain-containing protein n=1 Tax=Oculimacula yallundae TaxID=86028 RepID=A0ABR4C938_9HELO
MRRPTTSILNARLILCRQYGTSQAPPPVIRITNGTFYRHHPNSHHAATQSNPPLFANLNFSLPAYQSNPKYWAIIGPSSSGKTTFLQILRGKHLAIPAAARSWPFLESDGLGRKTPSTAIKLVGFDGEQGIGQQAPQSAYLSARYESRREDTDFSVLDYLQGNTELNPLTETSKKLDKGLLKRVIEDLRLQDLIDMPVSNLSNGQTRRARIASALLGSPEVFLLDEPFMGLDPPTLLSLSPMLYRLAEANAPRLVLSLRPQDPIPDWITHLIFLKGNCEVAFQGAREDVLWEVRNLVSGIQDGRIESNRSMLLHSMHEVGRILTKDGIAECIPSANTVGRVTSIPQKGAQNEDAPRSRDGFPLHDVEKPVIGEPLIQMDGVKVQYGSKVVLGNWKQEVPSSTQAEARDGLWWDVKRGERWGIFGPNGSGKTTLLSLICSDHPQTYGLPIKLFGRSRIPEPGQKGISIFDLQARIGHSSPEIHSHIPKSLTLRQVLQNAWADTFRGLPRLDKQTNEKIDACLQWFEQDLRSDSGNTATGVAWANDILFGGMPFSSQRVALFLRAVIKNPDLVILDEAFSGMDDGIRDRCLLFLAHGQTKQFSAPSSTTKSEVMEHTASSQRPRIVESEVSKRKQVKVHGLNENQALLCISHVREEIPGSIREWICLPEANTGEPARFGRLDGPIEGNYRRWSEIWGMRNVHANSDPVE